MSNRIQRVNSLIKNELSQILLKGTDFSKDILVTVTGVETSGNLNQAKVYISVMPENRTSKVLEILDRKIYDFQQELNKHLNMRPIPKIKFVREKKTEEAARVEELLEKIKEEKND